ncbi:MAG TPA: diacylglycerol kinase, partial [Myxococcota bacterium]|nr:diacylglycerol kinase [Myxococcota bacterium]
MSKGRPLRVIQWATGSIGRHAIAAIAEDPRLELAGVWVHSEAKDGLDA